MNKLLMHILLLVTVSVAGCAESSAMIKHEMKNPQTVIFEESTTGEALTQGETVLSVISSVKTHAPRPSIVRDTHGTDEFRMLVRIDGQTVSLKGDAISEKNASFELNDPENGSGIRYRFSTKMRLKAGVHRIVVALPDDGVTVERDVELIAGKAHTLVVQPVYANKVGKPRLGVASKTSFKEGIRTFELLLDGETSK
jgi:hypothetical protein